MRLASASWLTSPKTEEAVPPVLVICSTRLSTPPQLASMSSAALNSLATPAGRKSETTTATPLAASARAVELPMPIGLPQPVIKATRVGCGTGASFALSPSPAMRERGCYLNRPGALELRPVHQPAGRRVERVAAVHRTAIVPPHQIAD